MNKTAAVVTYPVIDQSYRVLYGKLYSALLLQFGSEFVTQIEDAIQNAFYKALKSWKPAKVPKDKQAWFYLVARNDLLNQIKKAGRAVDSLINESSSQEHELPKVDLRLHTMLFLASDPVISTQAKVIFILKNIFGLHVKEISSCTLMGEAAIYKSIKRTQLLYQDGRLLGPQNMTSLKFDLKQISIVEQILYAVFSIGFDSFDEKNIDLINEDLCLESLALAKMLLKVSDCSTTKNLIALFCFHLARMPAKVVDNQLISFFNQDTSRWNHDFLNLGLRYLEKPDELHKFYLEAIIVSRHMTASTYDEKNWDEIIDLYTLLECITNSPVVKINLAFCLSKAGMHHQALAKLESIENDLPEKHFYFSLVKAALLKKDNSQRANAILTRLIAQARQQMRQVHLMTI